MQLDAPKVTWISDFTLVEHNKSHYYDAASKDVVTVLTGDDDNGISWSTIIWMKFTKMGIYSWHCHILSYKDHEMIRPHKVISNKAYSNTTSLVKHIKMH